MASACGLLASLLLCAAMPGCGTTKSVTATEQLLMSDAVDSTISKMDFRPISGYKIYLDTTYVASAGKAIPGIPMQHNLVNSDYVISALRQQLTAAGCMLVDNRDAADIICEARCGALGTDGHNVIYGVPANNFLNSASMFVSNAPTLPSVPEIALAKREVKSAAAKVAVFAYDRETREPLWQSGIAQAGSNARDTWFMGVGPIQYGSIYSGTRFAGKRIRGVGAAPAAPPVEVGPSNGIDHRSQYVFSTPMPGSDGDSELADSSDGAPAGNSGSIPQTAQGATGAPAPEAVRR